MSENKGSSTGGGSGGKSSPELRPATTRSASTDPRLTDALRAVNTDPGVYTFWDYQAGAWQKNHGLRIDHLLLSPQAADRLVACEIDADPRSWEKPSDHVPIVVELSL